MQIKSFLNIGNISLCVHDDISLYIISKEHDQLFHLSIIEPYSLKLISTHILAFPVNYHLKPCVDDDCIYIPTTQGEIIGIDKFSGSKIVTIDLGCRCIVADPIQENVYIYSLCGIPLSSGIKTNTDFFSLQINDKMTGKLLLQGQSMKGDILQMAIDDDSIWSVVGKTLYKFNKGCDEIGHVNLQFPSKYKPIITKQYICCTSPLGSVEIFNKGTFRNHGKLITRKNDSFPILHNQDMIWAVGNLVFKIDIEIPKAQHIGVLPGKVAGESVIIDNNLFNSSLDGRIFQYNLQSLVVKQLRVSNKQVYNLFKIKNHLIFLDNDKVYNVEVPTATV